MNPISALKKFLFRQKSVPQSRLEFLFTDSQGIAIADEVLSNRTGEDRLFLQLSLSFLVISGLRTRSLIESLRTVQTKLNSLTKRDSCCSFDGVFVEVLAFFLFIVMQDYWKNNERDDDLDEEDEEYYDTEENASERGEFFNAVKHARHIADGYISSFSSVPVPNDFLAKRILAYSDVVFHKKDVFEKFIGNVLDRVCINEPNNPLSLDRALLSSVCMAFILDSKLERFILTCKESYREYSSESTAVE